MSARKCLQAISTIPQVYELNKEGGWDHRSLEQLQIQLRADTLDLSSLIADLETSVCQNETILDQPPSPTTSARAASVLGEDFSNASSRTSMSGNDGTIIQKINSRGLAINILLKLHSHDVLRTGDIADGRSSNDWELSSQLRDIIRSFCTEIQMPTSALSTLFYSTLYDKAHSMIRMEISFLSSQLLPIFHGSADLDAVKLSNDITFSPSDEYDVIPTFLVEDVLLSGRPFGRLKLRLRRLLGQEIPQIIRDEVLRSLPLSISGLQSAVFHVIWDLPGHLQNEFGERTDISQVLAITGGSSHAYAARCIDYLRWWGDWKYDICTPLQHFLENGAYGKPLFNVISLPGR